MMVAIDLVEVRFRCGFALIEVGVYGCDLNEHWILNSCGFIGCVEIDEDGNRSSGDVDLLFEFWVMCCPR